MTRIVVQDETIIARPIEVVQAQFVDMEHHAAAGVHDGLEITNIRPQEGGCRFTARRLVWGKVQENENEVLRDADGNSTVRSLSGPNEGLLVRQVFESLGPERTRVQTTVELPVKGLLRLLAPLVRKRVKRDLAGALEEDRLDLEERGYPRT